MPKILRNEVLTIEDAWYELLYGEARLLYDDDANDLAKETSQLVDRAEQVRVGQLKAWRKEVIAQAHVDARNESLDELTREFEKQLYRFIEDDDVKEPTKDPRYKAYFPEPLSRTVILGLETQVKKTRYFISALQKESSPVLQAFAARFTQEFSRADIAIQGLHDAQVERRNHRNNDINALFEDANNLRQSTYGRLTARGAERKLGRDWAERFFRHSTATSEDPRDLKRRAILLSMSARGVEVSKENKQRINNEDNDTILALWLSRAGSVTEQSALFG